MELRSPITVDVDYGGLEDYLEIDQVRDVVFQMSPADHPLIEWDESTGSVALTVAAPSPGEDPILQLRFESLDACRAWLQRAATELSLERFVATGEIPGRV